MLVRQKWITVCPTKILVLQIRLGAHICEHFGSIPPAINNYIYFLGRIISDTLGFYCLFSVFSSCHPMAHKCCISINTLPVLRCL